MIINDNYVKSGTNGQLPEDRCVSS